MASSGAKPKHVKKTGHVVASRYKQAAEKISIEKSSMESKLYRNKSTFNETCRKEDTVLNSKLSKSEEYRGKTSTPTSKGELLYPSLDASAVTDKEKNALPDIKKGMLLPSVDSIKQNLVQKKKMFEESVCGSRIALKGKKSKKFNKELAEEELSIHYAHYLQAVFLDMKARETLKKRSEIALENIHKLLNLVLVYKKIADSKWKQVQVLTILLRIAEHCQKQEEILKPLFDIIPTLNRQLRNLSEAINITKHNLAVKDVIIPDESNEDEMFEIINTIKQAITNYFEEFSSIKETIKEAGELVKYIEAAELLSENLKTAADSIKELEDLVVTEATLMIGGASL